MKISAFAYSTLVAVVAICSAGILAACGKGYEPLKQTRHTESFQVIMNLVPEDKIQGVCKELGVEYAANGCNSFDIVTKTCNVYVMPQRYMHDEARLAIIGHEIYHCMSGRWHD